MADQTDYKHIKVGPHDDDVVIYAGSPARAQIPVEQTEAADAASAAEAVGASGAVDASATRPEPESGMDGMSNADSSRYRPTTLSDIEQSKMPFAQKAVIVVALVLIAAFVVWYAIFGGNA